jgi:hypothetical protein
VRRLAVVPETNAAASAVRARAPAATPVGRPHYRTAGAGCVSRVRIRCNTPGDRSKKILPRGLGAGPRSPASDTRTRAPTPRWRLPEFQPTADAPRSALDTVGTAPGVFPDHRSSGDTAEPLSFASTAGLRFGTPGCNTAIGDGPGERSSRIPSADTFAAEADVPLDWPVWCGKLDVGPRKLRTSNGQASDAESYCSAPRRLLFAPQPSWPERTLQAKRAPDRFQATPCRDHLTETRLLRRALAMAEIMELCRPLPTRRFTGRSRSASTRRPLGKAPMTVPSLRTTRIGVLRTTRRLSGRG